MCRLLVVMISSALYDFSMPSDAAGTEITDGLNELNEDNENHNRYNHDKCVKLLITERDC
jgi:hypothetical protein